MSKQSGINWTTMEVDDATSTARDIKNDVTDLEISITRAVDEVTGLDSSSMERLLLLGDASLTMNGVVNFASNQSHDTLSTAANQDVTRTITATISSNTFTGDYLITDYKTQRGADAKFRWSSSLVLQSGTDPAWS